MGRLGIGLVVEGIASKGNGLSLQRLRVEGGGHLPGKSHGQIFRHAHLHYLSIPQQAQRHVLVGEGASGGDRAFAAAEGALRLRGGKLILLGGSGEKWA